MEKFTINQVIANPALYNAENSFGFHDWFCRDSSLEKKFEAALRQVKQLVKMGMIDGDKHSFWLKNNCPVNGNLYDDIRFNTIEGDEYIGGVAPWVGYANMRGGCSFWLASEEFKAHDFKNWAEFKKFAKANNVTFGNVVKAEKPVKAKKPKSVKKVVSGKKEKTVEAPVAEVAETATASE